jgi:hypothetical protein
MIGTVIMMVGLPMSGKSFVLSKNKWTLQVLLAKMNVKNDKEIITLSSDDIVNVVSDSLHITYNEAWEIIHSHLSDAFEYHVKDFFEKSSLALEENGEIVYDVVFWDQTNLSKKSRVKKLFMIPEGWKKIALVFPEPLKQELIIRKEKRKLEGKEIPDKIYKNMKKSYTKPTLEEGFDFIFDITEVLPELYENDL